MAQHYPNQLTTTIFASFAYESLVTIRQLAKQQNLGFGLHQWDNHWFQRVDALQCLSIHVNHWILSKKRVQELKKSGCYVFAYTVDKAARAQRLLAWGVDGVFTNYPDAINGALCLKV